MEANPVQQIKERLDIVEVVSGYLKLEKTGINFRARCPFHAEKGPSFFVSPARQMFKCFGCGASGSVFDFVMRIDGMEFGDALRFLAKRAGVELKNVDPQVSSKRARLFEVCEFATRFFEKYLNVTQAGQLVKQYLQSRGLKEETIKKWRLGYAPDSWRSLIDFLNSQDYKREEVVEAGLAIASERSQTPYDRFRNRIMFPIFDLNGQVVGFGGRVFDKIKTTTQGQSEGGLARSSFSGGGPVHSSFSGGGAKYVNISNTPLYDKSRVLYGLNFAKLPIRQKDACILTEGYMDVILSHQAGFDNTVAASGTALTPYQLQIIKRYTNNLFSAFDMDAAGNLATTRSISLAQKADFNVRVITMEQGSDPADIIAKNEQDWIIAVSQAKEIMDFYFDLAQVRHDKNSPQGKKEIGQTLLPLIKRIPNKIVQSHWLQKLAVIIKTSEEVLVQEMQKFPEEEMDNSEMINQPPGAATLNNQGIKSRREMLEERIMCLLCLNPENLCMVGVERMEAFSPIVKKFLQLFEERNFNNKEEVLAYFNTLEIVDLVPVEVVEYLSFGLKEEVFDPNDKMAPAKQAHREKKLMEELGECLKNLADLNQKNHAQGIAEEIRIAEQQGDQEKLKELLENFCRHSCVKK